MSNKNRWIYSRWWDIGNEGVRHLVFIDIAISLSITETVHWLVQNHTAELGHSSVCLFCAYVNVFSSPSLSCSPFSSRVRVNERKSGRLSVRLVGPDDFFSSCIVVDCLTGTFSSSNSFTWRFSSFVPEKLDERHWRLCRADLNRSWSDTSHQPINCFPTSINCLKNGESEFVRWIVLTLLWSRLDCDVSWYNEVEWWNND